MTRESLVAALHAAPIRLALAVTGGGSLAISDLLTVPGASRTVVEAIVPYASQSVDRMLGARPEHYCSEESARQLAMAAWTHARELLTERDSSVRVLGLGATASLASTRVKQGPHRIHLALQSQESTRVTSLELDKGARSRQDEERLVADLILNELAAMAPIDARLDLATRPTESAVTTEVVARQSWQELLSGQRQVVPASAAAEVAGASRHSRLLFPGAFHPLHEGHRGMAEVAAERLGQPVDFELSIWNVDKPPLDFVSIAQRIAQFPAESVVWLTRAPTFVEKARLFPGCTFVVGIDTLVRIGEPRYYGGGDTARDAAIEQLTQLGARFLVFGRKVGPLFESLDNLQLPPALQNLCDSVDESEFRMDVSSTELRRAGISAAQDLLENIDPVEES